LESSSRARTILFQYQLRLYCPPQSVTHIVCHFLGINVDILSFSFQCSLFCVALSYYHFSNLIASTFLKMFFMLFALLLFLATVFQRQDISYQACGLVSTI